MTDDFTINTRSEGLLGKIGQWGAAFITDEELLEALAAHDAEVRAAAVSVGSGEPHQHVAEEPEWEYGTESRFEESSAAYEAIEWGSREQAEEVARDRNAEEVHEDGYVRLVYSLVKRVPAVPAGPWVPVKQEGSKE